MWAKGRICQEKVALSYIEELILHGLQLVRQQMEGKLMCTYTVKVTNVAEGNKQKKKNKSAVSL